MDLERRATLSSLVGTAALIYYRKRLRWRLYGTKDEFGLRAKDLIEHFCRYRPDGAKESLLFLIVPRAQERRNALDNPILTRALLDSAQAARIDSVLLDRDFGLFYDDDADPAAAPVTPPGPAIYLA